MQPTVNCACVIHSNGYTWDYVENLYKMLQHNLSYPLTFHVFTEPSRVVPPHMVKHDLVEWPGIEGPRQSWWYKLQLFNKSNFAGKLLYFDLDVVLTGSLDWVVNLDPRFFWSINDFKKLFRPDWTGINSSVMYWDTVKFNWIWQHFSSCDIREIMRTHRGDQDYLNSVLNNSNRKYMPASKFKSWRWQVENGGLDWKTKTPKIPGAGAVLDPELSGVIFHGSPKPHEVSDPTMQAMWNIDK